MAGRMNTAGPTEVVGRWKAINKGRKQIGKRKICVSVTQQDAQLEKGKANFRLG
jgi:hypothetical protein